MTDYIDGLQEALRDAATREYPQQDAVPGSSSGRQTGRRRRSTGARRWLARRVVALACVAAVLAFAVANLASTGRNSVIVPAQAQVILRHVRAALAFPPHAIYEEKVVSTVTARNGETFSSGSQEWLPTSPPYDGRLIESAGGKVIWEQAFVHGRLDLYDPSTQTIYLAPRVRRHQIADTPQSTSELSEVLYLLNQPESKVTIDASARLDGKHAIKLTDDGGRFSFWISPRTYQPLQTEDRQDSLPNGQHGIGIDRYPIVRTLTGTAAAPRLLSLKAQHPNAEIDHSAGDYAAAYRRLIQNAGAKMASEVRPPRQH